jgi:hypothetical protein
MMPKVQANGIEINYEVHGDGEPMVLLPYLAADQACYSFQVAEYEKYYRASAWTCAARACPASPRASTPPSCSPRTSRRSWGPWASTGRISSAAPLSQGIANSEVIVFEDCAHAAIYQDVAGFNARTLAFLERHSG